MSARAWLVGKYCWPFFMTFQIMLSKGQKNAKIHVGMSHLFREGIALWKCPPCPETQGTCQTIRDQISENILRPVPTSWWHVKKSGTKVLKIFFTHVPTSWRHVKNMPVLRQEYMLFFCLPSSSQPRLRLLRPLSISQHISAYRKNKGGAGGIYFDQIPENMLHPWNLWDQLPEKKCTHGNYGTKFLKNIVPKIFFPNKSRFQIFPMSDSRCFSCPKMSPGTGAIHAPEQMRHSYVMFANFSWWFNKPYLLGLLQWSLLTPFATLQGALAAICRACWARTARGVLAGEDE